MIISKATDLLCEGMVLAENICTSSGELLAREGDTITAEIIRQLELFSVTNVLIYMNGATEDVAHSAHIKRNGFLITEDDFSKNLREILVKDGKINVKTLLDGLNDAIKEQEEKKRLILLLEDIRENKKELFRHMVSVALLSQLLAKWLGCSKEEEKIATLAGLMHDVGLAHVMDERKGAIIFKEELHVHAYEKHVTDGHHMLKTLKMPPAVIKAVLAHHERIDGRGYPLKIVGAYINKIGRIIAIADTYDTYTMKNRGEYGYTVLKALKTLEEDGSHKLDSGYVQVFIDNILDSVLMRSVGLSDGTIGRVVMNNKYDLLYPVVECKGKIIDLSIKRKLYVEELL